MPTSAKAPVWVTCPKCNTPFRLDEALVHEIRKEADREYEQRLQTEVDKARSEGHRAAEKEAASQLDQLLEENNALKKQELDLRKERQRLEREKEDLELEGQREVDERVNAVRKEADERAEKKHSQRIAELEKQARDAEKKLGEAERKLQQGSQELQGTVGEETLEERLRAAFPEDEIRRVGKGQRGADIVQRVIGRDGRPSGVILWESKRAREWSRTWVSKLKDDQRREKAEVGVIVSPVLPPEKGPIGQVDGVWVTEPGLAEGLDAALRAGLLAVARERAKLPPQDTAKDRLYGYLASDAFIRRVLQAMEPLRDAYGDLQKVRDAMERQFASFEKQIRRAAEGVAGMVGDLQGLGAELQPVPILELPAPAA